MEAYNRLDDLAIDVRSATGAEDFYSSHFVQRGSVSHPALNPIGTIGTNREPKVQLTSSIAVNL
jgi:hypothetical protein